MILIYWLGPRPIFEKHKGSLDRALSSHHAPLLSGRSTRCDGMLTLTTGCDDKVEHHVKFV